jgi:hypothetical protein
MGINHPTVKAFAQHIASSTAFPRHIPITFGVLSWEFHLNAVQGSSGTTQGCNSHHRGAMHATIVLRISVVKMKQK